MPDDLKGAIVFGWAVGEIKGRVMPAAHILALPWFSRDVSKEEQVAAK
jgi:hypothetical protein